LRVGQSRQQATANNSPFLLVAFCCNELLKDLTTVDCIEAFRSLSPTTPELHKQKNEKK